MKAVGLGRFGWADRKWDILCHCLGEIWLPLVGLKLKVMVTLLCRVPDSRDPMDCSPPGSSVHGILQAKILELVATSFSRDLPDPGIESRSPTLQADRFFTH